MQWITQLMDWLPRLVLAVAAVAAVGCFLNLKISWKREGSVEFCGFKWPWKKER